MSDPPSSTALPARGSILADKYRVERTLGHGGMGVVVEARHIALDERVALKFLLPAYALHPEASARFLREARAAVRIKSEHVARVTDVGTLDTGAPYMVMEYLEGRDLARVVETTGVVSIPDAVDYIVQGCDAIAEAHGLGIVHRDLKPANLFLTTRPDGMPLVKVLDFGISKVTGEGVDKLTKTNALMGSALYMSPEQMQATRSVDHRTDIYALGVSLYELLAGRQPFFAETLPELCAAILTGTPTPLREARPDVPEALATVVQRAYERERGQRYPSVADFVVALAPYAPPRTQPIIERVARMGGLPLPLRAAPSSVPGAPAPASVPQPAPGAVVTGALSGPTSEPAVASAPLGSATNGALSTTTHRAGKKRTGWFVVALVATLGLAVGIAGLAIQRTSAKPPADPVPAVTTPAPATAAVTPTVTAEPVTIEPPRAPDPAKSSDGPTPSSKAPPGRRTPVSAPPRVTPPGGDMYGGRK